LEDTKILSASLRGSKTGTLIASMQSLVVPH